MNNTQKQKLIGVEALNLINGYESGTITMPPILDIPTLKFFINNNIQTLYATAQLVKCINGIEFYLSLKGDEYALIKSKILEAKNAGGAYIMFTATTGHKFYTKDIPYLLLNQFFYDINAVSTENHRRKESNLVKINKIQSGQDVDLLILEDFIYDTVLNINNFAAQIKVDIDNGVIPISRHTTIFSNWYSNVYNPATGEYTIFQAI